MTSDHSEPNGIPKIRMFPNLVEASIEFAKAFKKHNAARMSFEQARDDLEAAVKQLNSAREAMFKALKDGDCASPGNMGWEARFSRFIAELLLHHPDVKG